MPAANARFFQGSELHKTYLKVRGFNAQSGARTGGIKDPKQVDITAGTVLLRTYQDPARLFGEWWFTPYEMVQVVEYFGRGGPAFGEGRPQGKGILQATFAVRHEWGSNSPDHLGLVAAVRLASPIQAFFGEGDAAPDASQKQNLKPVFITDGSGLRRGVRQVFLPEAWTYQSSFTVLERECPTDVDVIRLARQHSSGPLPFEI
jgi:hypothetical protein